jgi:hypothetical protein
VLPLPESLNVQNNNQQTAKFVDSHKDGMLNRKVNSNASNYRYKDV